MRYWWVNQNQTYVHEVGGDSSVLEECQKMFFRCKVYLQCPSLLVIALLTSLLLNPPIVMATEMACQVDADCQRGYSCRSKPYGGTRCVSKGGATSSTSGYQSIEEGAIGGGDYLRDSASALDEARRAREEVSRVREEIQQDRERLAQERRQAELQRLREIQQDRERLAQERRQAELQRFMENERRQNQRMMDESWRRP